MSLEDALQGPENEHWVRAIEKEIKCFYDNDAWELADAPKGATIVKCRWVLKRKVIVMTILLIVPG